MKLLKWFYELLDSGAFIGATQAGYSRISKEPPMDTGVNAYSPTDRSRVKRLHERGHYDRDTVHAILDAGMLAHIAYVIPDETKGGQPYVTPTAYWRDGDVLYWHG